MSLTYLTGIKPSGYLHLGNFVSTIKPIIDRGIEDETLFLIADNHALTSQKLENVRKISNDIAKVLYSFGIKNIVFQSFFPEIMELTWILSCYTEKGLMNRSHSYKSIVQDNISNNRDVDEGINLGLYFYPILMTADLVLFECEKVFIGEDQKQHIEIARDIVNKFNFYTNSNILRVPDPDISKNCLLEGYDGRKMSKSYNNDIPLICSEKKLRKYIFSMKTNSKSEGKSKYWHESPVCTLYNAFATPEECEDLQNEMEEGIGWGQIKEKVFYRVNKEIKEGRDNYYNNSDQRIVLYTINELYSRMSDKIMRRINNIKKLIFK